MMNVGDTLDEEEIEEFFKHAPHVNANTIAINSYVIPPILILRICVGLMHDVVLQMQFRQENGWSHHSPPVSLC